MSSTAHWRQPPADPKPLGSSNLIKLLLSEDLAESYGIEQSVIVRADSRTAAYIKGRHDGMRDQDAGKASLAEFLEDLRVHGALEVWIDE